MKRAVVGGLLGAASYLAYQWTKGTPVSMLPSFEISPYLWASVVAGAVTAHLI